MKEINRNVFISTLRSLNNQVRELSHLHAIRSSTFLYDTLMNVSYGIDLALNHVEDFEDEDFEDE